MSLTRRPAEPTPAFHLIGRSILLLVLGLTACRSGPQPAPDEARPSPEPVELSAADYAQVVGAYFAAVDGLDAGDTAGALERLQRVTELAPAEPAGWANLALAHLRLNDPETADGVAARARDLAPQDGDIALLAALVKSRLGGGEGALPALREAVAVAPENLRARYALYQELARGTDAASQVEAAEALSAVLAAAPQNQVARVEEARVAARVGDAAAVKAALGILATRAAGWDSQARNALAEAQAASDGADLRALGQRLAVLGNVLSADPGYQADLARLQSPSSDVGQPLRTFLRLPMPRAEAYPADTALSFSPQALPENARGAWAVPMTADDPPVPAYVLGADLILAGDPPLALAAPLGDAVELPAAGLVSIDWNNDRRPDLALAGPGGLRLYEQGADGTWTDVSDTTGLPADLLGAAYLGVWALDIDLDGDLDLVLGVEEGRPPVLQNNGDGTWTVTEPLDLPAGPSGLIWADFDGDGDGDLAVLSRVAGPGESEDIAIGELWILWNERSGVYRPEALDGRYSALAVADADVDGLLDVIALRADGTVLRWSPDLNGDWHSETLVSIGQSTALGSAGLLWADLDRNGAADLVLSDGSRSWAWLGGPEGSLGAVENLLPGAARALADLDGDGRIDALGQGANGSGVWLNAGGAQDYHWQVVRPRGVDIGDQRVNSFGLGGEVSLRSGLLSQTLPIAGPAVHFGLGAAEGADVLRIRWPNGVTQTEFDVPADKVLVAEQRLKGSCPWLFADDGTGQKFVTDILWKSPLGLRINAQDTAGVAQTLDWVKVRGDQLAARDGRYHLAITAELWETHYFDHVALMVVDHPDGSEVFVDERFVIPPPEPALVTTGPLVPVSRARDHRGRDVTAIVRATDGDYLDGFTLSRYQGLAEDHYVELELDTVVEELRAAALAAGRPDPRFVLVGQGWLYPTDSSINVALGQGGHPAPSSLRLEVPDAAGTWRVARADQGFPAGKQKTALFALDGLDPAGAAAPERLRLATNLEIYWDRLALAELRPELDPRVTTLAPDLADLRYRGFSVTNYTDPRAPVHRPQPELPDYDRPRGSGPLWLDLVGYYTRFGDVRPLLAAIDDRYAILNAGDEIRLTFPAPAPPATGLVRGFIFVSDGWEKDGDFNTAYSETVLPLPAHDRPEYADPLESGPVGALEDDPVYQRFPQDWVDYHTRYVGPPRWYRR